MKKTRLFIVLALIGAVALFATNCGGDKCTYDNDKDCYCKENPSDPRCEGEATDCTFDLDPICFCEENPDDERCGDQPGAGMPDSIANGSDFYIIYMDAATETSLGDKVKVSTMVRSIDVWEKGETLAAVTPMGPNSWGLVTGWLAFKSTATLGWAGGGIVAPWLSDTNSFPAGPPDLQPVTDNPDDYYFHFAIKSPSGEYDDTWTLVFNNNYTEKREFPYIYGSATGRFPNYGDGEWYHYEIPVSELVAAGYKWETDMRGYPGRYILSFINEPSYQPGTELHLDAMFFYKKPAQ